MPRSARVFSRDFKLLIIRRMVAGEPASGLARELRVRREDLYVWRDRFNAGGAEALRGRGRRSGSAAEGDGDGAAGGGVGGATG